MRKTPTEVFHEYITDDDVEQSLYDATGGDWDDLVAQIESAFKAGWNAALENLTTRDI